ncbi:hypothetical protein ACFLZG_02075 [Thermodesulfobacteriota bacterium]
MKQIISLIILIMMVGISSIAYSAPGDEIWLATWGPTWESSPINEASEGACDGFNYIHLIWDRKEPSSQPIDTWWLIGNQLYNQIDETTAEVWIGSCEESHSDGETADIDGDGVIDTEDYDPNDPNVTAGLSEEAYNTMMALAGILSGFMLWFGIIVNT